MKNYWLQLLICSVLIANAGSTVAAGKDQVHTDSLNPAVQSSQSQLEPRETQQSSEPCRDEKKIQDNFSTQGISIKLSESDLDRLRDLEQEITEEQLTIYDRSREK